MNSCPKGDGETLIEDSPLRGSLVSKVSGPLVKAAAATAAVTGVVQLDDSGSAQAAVVSWTNANLVIPATTDGLYINVETKVTGSAASVVAGWDLNPYSSNSLTWFVGTTGTGMMRFPGVTTGSAGSLAAGTEVGATGSYGSGAVIVGSAPGNWQLNSNNYFGFRFVAADGLTHYGWGKMVVGAAITTRTIESLYYESLAATSIFVDVAPPPPPSAVPEPASISIFAMGAVGVLIRRRMRAQKAEN